MPFSSGGLFWPADGVTLFPEANILPKTGGKKHQAMKRLEKRPAKKNNIGRVYIAPRVQPAKKRKRITIRCNGNFI